MGGVSCTGDNLPHLPLLGNSDPKVSLVAGAWTERKKIFHGGSFLKLADDNMDIQNPEAQNRAFFVSQSMLLPLVCASRNVPHRYDEGGGAEEGIVDDTAAGQGHVHQEGARMKRKPLACPSCVRSFTELECFSIFKSRQTITVSQKMLHSDMVFDSCLSSLIVMLKCVFMISSLIPISISIKLV